MSEDNLRERLLAGERVLWTGAPPRGLLLTARDTFLIPFSLMWGGFAVFWEWSVSQDSSGNAPDFFVLWGIPFVLVGLYVIFGRFLLDAWARGSVSYAVTDRRVLVLRTRPSFKFSTYALDRLPELSLEERANGRGTINFQPGTG